MTPSATVLALRSHSRRARAEFHRARVVGDDVRRVCAAAELRALLALVRQLEAAVRSDDLGAA